jgi:hypothetical protein
MLDEAGKDRRYAIQDAVGKLARGQTTRNPGAIEVRTGSNRTGGPPGHSRPAFQCRRGPGEAGRPCHAFVQPRVSRWPRH